MVNIILVSIFINFFTFFFLSILLGCLGRRYRSFAIFNINLCLWSLFYGLYITTQYSEIALLYSRLASFFLSLLAFLALRFSLDITGTYINPKYTKLNAIITVILSVSMFTPLMIKGVKPYLDFRYIPDVTPFYYAFILHYAIVTAVVLKILYSSIQEDHKNKLIFIGFSIGAVSGPSNVLPYIDIPLYPVTNFLVGLYSIITSYAIIVHRLPDIIS